MSINDRVIITVVSSIVVMFAWYGFNGYANNKYQQGLDRGVSIMYKRMNTDLIKKVGIHYNPETRTFKKWEERTK